jgi:ElaB/YqjD/DUF883 family membrane-anchored ribosome-binding protein
MTDYANTYRTAALTARRTLQAAFDITCDVTCDDDNAHKLATKMTLVRAAHDVLQSASDTPAPTIEQIKDRLRDALPDYRRRGYEPSHGDMITDISAEVAKMIEEARR